MSDLISGKEALIALANGEEVEWRHPERDWFKAPKCNMRTQDFFSGIYQFRLKPKTILLNGIEVPAPFEPKKGEDYFYLTDESGGGYDVHKHDGCTIEIAAWRSEEQIKQVVAALRSIFNAK